MTNLILLIFQVGCKAILVFFQYGVMANFYWLLVEGLYLHILLVLIFSPNRHFTIYLLIGWGKNLHIFQECLFVCFYCVCWSGSVFHTKAAELSLVVTPQTHRWLSSAPAQVAAAAAQEREGTKLLEQLFTAGFIPGTAFPCAICATPRGCSGARAATAKHRIQVS